MFELWIVCVRIHSYRSLFCTSPSSNYWNCSCCSILHLAPSQYSWQKVGARAIFDLLIQINWFFIIYDTRGFDNYAPIDPDIVTGERVWEEEGDQTSHASNQYEWWIHYTPSMVCVFVCVCASPTLHRWMLFRRWDIELLVHHFYHTIAIVVCFGAQIKAERSGGWCACPERRSQRHGGGNITKNYSTRIHCSSVNDRGIRLSIFTIFFRSPDHSTCGQYSVSNIILRYKIIWISRRENCIVRPKSHIVCHYKLMLCVIPLSVDDHSSYNVCIVCNLYDFLLGLWCVAMCLRAEALIW